MEDDNKTSCADAGVQMSEDGQEQGSVNVSPTLEIVVDGSEFLSEGGGREDLELSITFDKVDGAEGIQCELAERLDGVELLVSLRGTQAVGVEVVSARHENEDPQQPFSAERNIHALPLGSSDGMEDAVGFSNISNALPASEAELEAFEQTNLMEECNQRDCHWVIEKKRQREDAAAAASRCLKLKKQEEELPVDSLERYNEPAKPDANVNFVNGSQPVDSQHTVSTKTEVEEGRLNGSNARDLSESTRVTTRGENISLDEIIDEAKEACVGQGMDGPQHSNESTEVVSLDSLVKTSSSANERGRSRPWKRRKIAMLLAYCGAGYQGMQKNPGAVTIEGLLEEALLKAGAMPENYDGNPRKVDWMRAARTDKGVSAVGQVVSGLFYIDPPGFIERVNAYLPKQICLLGYKRVTPTFNAKNLCDRRRYEYVIPIFALDPSTHRDREAVLASEGKEDAFLKCQECSERGRKIPAGKVLRKLSVDGLENEILNGHSAASESTSLPINGEATSIATEIEKPQHHVNHVDVKPQANLGMTDLTPLDAGEAKQGLTGASFDAKKEHFRFGDVECAKLNRILSHYVGTHNFHNFTSRVKAEDPSAKRYVVSFQVGDVFTVRNTEFVRCIVVGQSFMLHQIRKMIGLAIAVFRDFTQESIIDAALRRDTNITIPTAPELGLFLDECMYPAYNQKWFATHEEVSQKGHEKEIYCFKQDVIYEHIAVTEEKEGQMALFLHSLNERNYADLASARDAVGKVES